MCHKILFTHNNIIHRVSYTDLKAKVPVLFKNGTIKLFTWGRNRWISSKLPLGSFASLNEIYAGRWDEFFPKPVKLPIKAFLARDINKHTRWFHLPHDKWIQGLAAHHNKETRVYIVTLTPTEVSMYSHWPRILLGGNLFLMQSGK